MSLERPDPPKPAHLRRRPFEDLIAELAARTGRPCWPVTHAYAHLFHTDRDAAA